MAFKRAVVATDPEGKEGAFMPAVPALQLEVEEVACPETIAPEILDLLKDPLIKTKASQPIEGIASGKRSAILTEPKTGALLRLKGCGNLDQGFPVEPLAWPPQGTSHEVRDC